MAKLKRVIISGGGTGGHIFPAIAIADEIKRRNPDADIRFVGANGKMEMEKVPAAGYPIEGLDIAGLKRKFALSNFLLPFKIIRSMMKARKIVKRFKPQVAVGVGGYASGPTLKAATMLGVPALIQEQNAFAGKTNKLLAKSVAKICVAYDGLEKVFPAEKIVMTGNPTRKDMITITGKEEEGYAFYGFDPTRKTLLIIGGSLGARTLNDSVLAHFDELKASGVQVLWQCGKLYLDAIEKQLDDRDRGHIHLVEFIARMDLAYAIADVVISRAGAISVSELCLVHKPSILVPSPNVAEDHQTKNAMALVHKQAAILIKDSEAREQLVRTALELVQDPDRCHELAAHMQALGKPNATADIVNELEKIIA